MIRGHIALLALGANSFVFRGPDLSARGACGRPVRHAGLGVRSLLQRTRSKLRERLLDPREEPWHSRLSTCDGTLVRAPAALYRFASRFIRSNALMMGHLTNLCTQDFFRSSVGGLQRVLLSYNERGNSTGMATLTFANAEKAREAVKKFNGAPIDGGKSRLRLNLIVDPTRKPLAARIAPVAKGPERSLRVARPDPAVRRDTRAPTKKAVAAKAQKRKPKPQKKSLEQLDQEMADYFDEAKK